MTTNGLVHGISVNSAEGPTTLSVFGSGPPLVVVHGGPGLEQSYFLPWLEPLFTHRTLVFYDQFGAGGGKSVPATKITAELLTNQLLDVLSFVGTGNGAVGVFAHSFGTHLALEALTRLHDTSIDELILCNPFALTASRFAVSGERLMARIPPDVIEQIEKYETERTEEAGRALMYAALPYYVASPTAVPPMHFDAYSMDVNASVFGMIGDFDITGAAARLPARTLLLYGRNDFLQPDDSLELRDMKAREVIVPDAGHFPFAEQPRVFLQALEQFFSTRSQR